MGRDTSIQQNAEIHYNMLFLSLWDFASDPHRVSAPGLHGLSDGYVRIRCSTGDDVMIQLVVAFAPSRIDYCNAVLAGLPRTVIEPLQRAQNAAAARLVFGPRSSDHITPALAKLHSLAAGLVSQQIQTAPACASDHGLILYASI